MQFENNLIYHVYNQGNDHQTTFFSRENYLFFLKKMRTHLLPHADVLCYCLMPNHFHWLIRVNAVIAAVPVPPLPGFGALQKSSDDLESSDDFCSAPKPGKEPQVRTLNLSIAILLRSYTRAINKQENRTGVLFRPHTKSKTGWIDEFITVDRYRNGKFDFRAFPDDEYGYNCFQYIHQNPVESDLSSRPEDWEFSSASDFAGLRNGTLCNQNLAKELLRLP